jgi:hypothetical protein
MCSGAHRWNGWIKRDQMADVLLGRVSSSGDLIVRRTLMRVLSSALAVAAVGWRSQGPRCQASLRHLPATTGAVLRRRSPVVTCGRRSFATSAMAFQESWPPAVPT